MRGKKRLGQTWSLDLILAAGVFILFIVGFYAIVANNEDKTEPEDLKDVADSISARLEAESGNEETGVIEEGEINQQKIDSLSQKDYDDLKRILGVNDDFCIYIEDENGRLVSINSTIGIGGDTISINGQPCNAIIP